ncbi:zinc finger protein 69-like isoform X2 [Toxorhynchites rutilus septentrionalis]|uniref:zinc finger protein 69-like isoform X2 n=1 Tax=Toxorhynchites rutilus septentrionalis TaxID=329112 RepID=UPI002478459F|nr:zinc finger protein 69-like isoform X2 [Toxorhynchites rutilus septentrionalis]
MEQDFEIDDHYHNELSDNDNISETDPMADFGPNGQKARSSVTRTGQLPQYCPHCSKSFTHFTALKMHVRTHAGEHPFICVQCPKTFKTYPAFKKHIKIHMAERPYPCPHCPKGFMQSHHLNRHISVHTPSLQVHVPYHVHIVSKRLDKVKPSENTWRTSMVKIQAFRAGITVKEEITECRLSLKAVRKKVCP